MDKLIIGLVIISMGLAILLISTNQTEQIPSDQTSEQITVSSPVQSTQTNEEYCNPSYPDVCIPAGPPDLDCDDIEYSNFTVLYPDEHRFDDDNDGIGCEQ
ncbi:MAG: hypothetical protein OEQ94_01815 [Nitrosopumilus sp.]|nr:hypothetical protein [Nitrosopumilus sp.]MDH3735741.1 hypothetical protein [Nitrosopumilus sp.]MDH3822128.1 hypothetical protein [Nitrosopumilus sp.]MDH3834052.1 hypothetical protein [Nitrosopumilus sp.]